MFASVFWRFVWLLIQFVTELIQRRKDRQMDAYFRDRFKN
jgi:hypothetical protein